MNVFSLFFFNEWKNSTVDLIISEEEYLPWLEGITQAFGRVYNFTWTKPLSWLVNSSKIAGLGPLGRFLFSLALLKQCYIVEVNLEAVCYYTSTIHGFGLIIPYHIYTLVFSKRTRLLWSERFILTVNK
jgi:hypothetical protein